MDECRHVLNPVRAIMSDVRVASATRTLVKGHTSALSQANHTICLRSAHKSRVISLLMAAGALQRLYRNILDGVQQPRQAQQEESGSAAAQGAPGTSSGATTVIVDNLSVSRQCTRQHLALAPCWHSTVYWAQSFLFGCLPSCFASCMSRCLFARLQNCCPAALLCGRRLRLWAVPRGSGCASCSY